MKITKKNLEKLIKEELEALLSEEPQKYFSRARNRLVSVDRPHPEDVRTPEFTSRSQVSLDPTKSVLDTLGDPGAGPMDPNDDHSSGVMGRPPAPLAMKGTTTAKISPKAKAKVTLDSDGNQVYDFKKGMTIRGTKPKTTAKISPKAKAKVRSDAGGMSVYDFEKGSTITAPKRKQTKTALTREAVQVGASPEEIGRARRAMAKKGTTVERALNKYADQISDYVRWMMNHKQHGPARKETLTDAENVLTELQLALRMMLKHAMLRYDHGAQKGDDLFLQGRVALEAALKRKKKP